MLKLHGAAIVLGAVFLTGMAGAQAQEAGMAFKVAEKGAGSFHCDVAPVLLAPPDSRRDEAAAVQPMKGLLANCFGIVPVANPAGRALPKGPYIVAGLSRDRAPLRDLLARAHAKLPTEGLGEEGYVMEVAADRILLTAMKPAGLFRGATALAGMAGKQEKELDIPAGLYADWPAMKWRGLHVLASSRKNLPAVETILTQVAPELRINRLILEVDYGFAFRSHPEMAAADGLTVEDCRHLTDLARSHFVEIIPQMNCLGHQSWAKNTGRLLTAHPEFDETPELPLDNPGIYCRSWCPSNPDVTRFAGDLMDELIDAFDAKSFHCGMDEVFILGECPRCKGKDNAALFAKSVNDLHAHLARRHVGMMIWGDRLLDGKATGYGKWEASENGTAQAIGMIPKDVVLCDWHYEKPADFPSVKLFQDAGFQVWPCGWNSAENARLLAGCALRNMSSRMAGYLATTWIGVDSVANALSQTPEKAPGKDVKGVVDGIRTGLGIAWSGGGV